MDQKSIALAWARAGWEVFPCYEVDTWVGHNLHLRKSPDTARGFKDATSDLDVIETYWTARPERLVGIRIPDSVNVGDIDLKVDPPKDGFAALEEVGLECPTTFCVNTPSGGVHYYYKKDPARKVKPTTDLKLANGQILEGVDRRTSGSYTIAYSVDAPKIEELTDAPDWLNEESEQIGLNPFSGNLKEWLEALDPGEPDGRVARAINRFPTEDFGHADMLRMQTELVKLGAERHTGVREAIEGLQALWLFGEYNTIRYQADWNSALEGAVRKFGGRSPDSRLSDWAPGQGTTNPIDPQDKIEKEVAKKAEQKYIELKATQIAANKIAAEGYTGSDEITVAELRETKTEFLVKDFLPVASIGFLVARSNLGKTFAYVDMCCRMACGMPWLGKATQQVKILIVLGEGRAGFIDRIDAWFEFHGQDPSLIEDYFFFVDGANLFSDVSIEKIAKVANREQVDLIVFDTWAATSGVVEENAGGLNSEALNRAGKIRPIATSLFVHHPTKATEKKDRPELRGSGALKGRADVVMTMYSDDGFTAATGEEEDWIALSTEFEHGGKNRNARTETVRGIYLQDADKENKVFAQIESEALSLGARTVRKHLTEEMTVKALAGLLGKSDSTAKRYLEAAIAEGIATRIVHPGSTTPDTFKLTELGEKANQINYRALLKKAKNQPAKKNL
jgi:RecA-family ATPase